MKHTTVILVLDGGRADHVNPQTMPFLHGLARQGASGSLTSPPGPVPHVALFTGRDPDTSGHLGTFAFDPMNSPYRWTRLLGPLRRLIGTRRSAKWVRRLVAKFSARSSGTSDNDPAWIPPENLPYFRPSLSPTTLDRPGALGVPSLFDLCRTHGLRYRYLASTGDDDKVTDTLVRELRNGTPNDLYVVDLRSIAIHGSEQGPHSDTLLKGHLREMDDRIASIHAAVTAGYGSWDLLICGPHGIAPVRQTVDIAAALAATGAEPAKDYVAFINGTLTSIWYLTEKGRREIDAILPTLPGSRVIGDERERLHLPPGCAWGDRIVAAEPGVLYRPDHLHPSDSRVLGIHGHLDRSEEGPGMLVVGSSRDLDLEADLRERPLVDAFATLCALLGVPTPPGQTGDGFIRTTTRRVETPRVGLNGKGDRKVIMTEH